MPDNPRRRLTVLDVLIVIAGFAAPIGIYRWLYPPAGVWPIWNMKINSHEDRVTFVTGLIYLAWPFLACGTLAFSTIKRIGPRPRLARLLRQPGSVAGFTALAFVAVSVVVSRLIADAVHLRPPTLGSMFSEEEHGQSIMAICRAGTGAGYAIASAWFLPALGRR